MENNYNDLNEYFATSDLPLATTLVVLGYPIKKYQRSPETGRVNFVFVQTKELEKTIESFWEGQLLVEPSRIFEVMKRIKTRLYSE